MNTKTILISLITLVITFQAVVLSKLPSFVKFSRPYTKLSRSIASEASSLMTSFEKVVNYRESKETENSVTTQKQILAEKLNSMPEITIPKFEKELFIVIKSSFKRNNKVWGTFRQYDENTVIYNKRGENKERITLAQQSSSIGSMMLKNGNAYFVKQVASDIGWSQMKVKALPYQSDKKDKTISIAIKSKTELLELYQAKINRVLAKHPETANSMLLADNKNISFGEMNCKNEKGMLDCDLLISVTISNPKLASIY